MPLRAAHSLFPTAALLLAASGAHAQLPAIAPTSLTAPLSAPSLPGPVAKRPTRATVTYTAGLLDVRANDSSLNSILREIARQTGMTITGGVADQRVFGDYGPAEPSVILATLLDGTGTNLFIRESADNQPAELVLTPRTPGGPTPPSPSSTQDEEEPAPPIPIGSPGPSGPPIFRLTNPSAQPGRLGGGQQLPPTATETAPPTATQTAPPLPVSGAGSGSQANSPSGLQQIPQPLNNVLGSPNAVSPSASTLPVTNSVATDSLPTPSSAQPVSGIVDSPSGPPAGTTTSGFSAAAQSNAASRTTPTNDADTSGSTSAGGSTTSSTPGGAPSGVKTPEQIFEQLQALRRANQAQQSGTGMAAPATTTPTASPTPQTVQPASSPQ